MNYFKLLCLLAALFFADFAEAQQDSVITPFRRGRWLTGLSGSISSGTTDFSSARAFANQYDINIATGIFIKDRMLLGLLFNSRRDNSERFTIREAETLFIGPSYTYYMLNAKEGSLFVSAAAGYVRFLEKSSVNVNGNPSIVQVKGDGAGMSISLGYSYVMHDRIAFDLGLSYSVFGVNAKRTTDLDNAVTDEAVRLGELSFMFGFNVLLDTFSF